MTDGRTDKSSNILHMTGNVKIASLVYCKVNWHLVYCKVNRNLVYYKVNGSLVYCKVNWHLVYCKVNEKWI